MAKAKQKDLFDDSVMTFGEHLEALRTHLWKALVGVALGTIVCLYYGDRIIAVIRKPIDDALRERNVAEHQVVDVEQGTSWTDWFKRQAGLSTRNAEKDAETAKSVEATAEKGTIQVEVLPSDLANVLTAHDPKTYPKSKPAEGEKPVTFSITSPTFAFFEKSAANSTRPITLTVQEAFMTYLKVSFISGLVLTSPWVIYQLWLFVAAGLYPHERKYVYMYLPMSVVLFLGGVVFCFFAVFPVVLTFMLSYNDYLETTPQIRLSEWISFAIILPLLFGVSFQLPMVMLFLERISIFGVKDYREKRRFAILAIAIIAMLLTPPDPLSMMCMMIPLLALYELGILLCAYSPSARSPFEAEATA